LESKTHNIVFTDADYYGGMEFIQRHWPRLLEIANVQLTDETSEQGLIEVLSDTDVVVVRRVYLTRPIFEACPRLKAVIKMGMGVERIDITAATDNGVIVANTPGLVIAVAEATILLMMAAAKNLLQVVEWAKTGAVPDASHRGFELYGKILGIIGYGRIGRHVASMAKGMGMRVLAYDPYVDPDRMRRDSIEPASLQQLLRESDFVSVNCPLTPETRHLIGAEELALMKPTAILVNTGRGGIVDDKALYEALTRGRIHAAGLDVFEEEPLRPDNPLLSLPNVVPTPHALGRTHEAMDRIAAMIEKAILDILAGELPEHTLNPAVKPKFA